MTSPFAGHLANTVVKDNDGTEYFATKVNPKNLVVINLVDGRPLHGAHSIFTFVRVMDGNDVSRRFALEAQWAADPKNPYRKPAEKAGTEQEAAPALPKIGLGTRVRIPAQLRLGNFPTDVDYVVIGVNAKTFNIVPLGGFGNGKEYARVSRGYLTIVEEPGK